MTDDSSRPPTCLICNNYFDRKPPLHNIPQDGEDAQQSGLYYYTEFNEAFKLFCELLNAVAAKGRIYDQSGQLIVEGLLIMEGLPEAEENGSHLFHRKGQPCCGDCNMALLDLLRLDKIIKEAEARQKEILGTLKMAIVLNQDNHSCQLDEPWVAVREKLIRNVTATGPDEVIQNEDDESETKEAFPGGNNESDSNYVLPDMNQPEVIMEDESLPLSFCHDPLGEEPPVKQRRGRHPRKQILGNRILENEAVVTTTTLPIKSCFIPLTRVDDVKDPPQQSLLPGRSRRKKDRKEKEAVLEESENESENDSEVNYGSDFNPESSINSAEEEGSSSEDDELDEIQPEYKPKSTRARAGRTKQVKKKKTPRPRGRPKTKAKRLNQTGQDCNSKTTRTRGKGEINFKSCFYLITKEILLYQNIPVKYQPDGLTCLETECSHFVEGTDYFAFQSMKAHIGESHEERRYEYGNIVRSCPVCQETFTYGRHLRKHILDEHASHPIRSRCTVICESCWKPLQFSSYLDHVWHHKNEEERASVIISGDKIGQKVKAELGLKLKQRRKREYPDNFRNGYFFFDIEHKNYLIHKGLLVEYTPTELICREASCDFKVEGHDYSAFIQIQGHMETSHATILKEPKKKLEGKRECPVCPQPPEFQCLADFKNHIFDVHSPLAICTTCWRPIGNYCLMGKHVWLHMNEDEREKSAAEGLCDGEYFPRMDAPAKQIFTCKSCPKQFFKQTYLRVHEKTHLPKDLRQKHRCDECGFEVLNRVSLRAHIEREHKPELNTRKLVCRICDREFNFRYGNAFRVHMRSHTGETPYVCEVCGKSFISTKTLNTHRKTVHSEARPYQCEFCDKNYKLDFVLKLHQKKAHKGLVKARDPEERMRNTPLQYRQELIGPVQMYPCDYCDKVFPFRSRRKYHVKTIHPEVSVTECNEGNR